MKALHAVREQRVPLANVCVHLGLLVMQMIMAKDAFYGDNVKSIKIVKVRKFASNSVVAFVIVLMHVANSLVDQTLCVFRIIIVQLVFVVINLLAIRMISMLAVNQANSSEYQTHVRVMLSVHRDKFVLLALMELKTV